jgi:hypothetical protein
MMPRSLFARFPLIAAVALCGWLAVPPLAQAGGVAYFGPVNQPGNAAATVHLIVGTKKVGPKKKEKPFELRRFTEFWVHSEPCIPNPPFPPSELSYKQFKFPEELLPIPIKKGSFSASGDPHGDGYATFEISGTVPRKGPASGTLRLTSTESVQHAPGPPPPPDPEERDHESVTCDTGVLSWEASVYHGPTDRTVRP